MEQLQKTVIDGQTYILVPEEDYEDLIDGIHAAEVMARIAAGEETWPAELVYELCETDSRIRTFRTYRKMTISELAAASGISDQDLSEIESGKQTGSDEVLTRIATALTVDLEDLVVVAVADEED